MEIFAIHGADLQSDGVAGAVAANLQLQRAFAGPVLAAQVLRHVIPAAVAETVLETQRLGTVGRTVGQRQYFGMIATVPLASEGFVIRIFGEIIDDLRFGVARRGRCLLRHVGVAFAVKGDGVEHQIAGFRSVAAIVVDV